MEKETNFFLVFLFNILFFTFNLKSLKLVKLKTNLFCWHHHMVLNNLKLQNPIAQKWLQERLTVYGFSRRNRKQSEKTK